MASESLDFEGYPIDDPGVQAYFRAMAELEAEEAEELQQEQAWRDAVEAELILLTLQENAVWQAGIRYVYFVNRKGQEREFLTIGQGSDLRAMRVVGGVPQTSTRVHPNRRRITAFGALRIDPDALANEYLEGWPDEDKLAENLLEQAKQNQEQFERYLELQRAAGATALSSERYS